MKNKFTNAFFFFPKYKFMNKILFEKYTFL